MVIDCTRLERTTNKLLPPTYKPKKQAQLLFKQVSCSITKHEKISAC